MSATDQRSGETLALVQRVEAAFNWCDFDAVMAEMTEDIVAEHVAPAVTGVGRQVGQAAVRAVFATLPERFPNYRFTTEDIFVAGSRCVYRWRLRRKRPDGGPGELRGVDIYTVPDSKIAEKCTYYAESGPSRLRPLVAPANSRSTPIAPRLRLVRWPTRRASRHRVGGHVDGVCNRCARAVHGGEDSFSNWRGSHACRPSLIVRRCHLKGL